MGHALVYVGIAVGVIAMGGVIAYGTANQANYLQDGAELAPAAEQGVFLSENGMVQLNKEQWHEDPFAEKAAAIRAAYEESQK